MNHRFDQMFQDYTKKYFITDLPSRKLISKFQNEQLGSPSLTLAFYYSVCSRNSYCEGLVYLPPFSPLDKLASGMQSTSL